LAELLTAAGVVAARRAGQAGPGAGHEAGAALSARRARVEDGARGRRSTSVELGGPAALDLGRENAELVLRFDVEEARGEPPRDVVGIE